MNKVMFILDTYFAAVAFCVITMLCWGSWANTQKLAAKNWRFELYYWDYSLGVLALAVVFALTLGSYGPAGRAFSEDLAQALGTHVLSAVLGGVVFNVANTLLVAAIAVAGMAVAFPVGIGIALVLGVILNYLAAPVGNPALLFSGVGLVVVAIFMSATAYRRLSRTTGGVQLKGIVLSVVSGVLMGSFYKFVASSMAADFSQPEAGKLGPYSAVLFFCLGVFVSTFIVTPIMMRKPVTGAPVKMSEYFRGSPRTHLMGVLGGIIWCVGMSFSIIASDKAGFAISYGLGQGATMVAALWGIFVWREFKGAPKGTDKLLALMLLAYLLGLVLIILARVYP